MNQNLNNLLSSQTNRPPMQSPVYGSHLGSHMMQSPNMVPSAAPVPSSQSNPSLMMSTPDMTNPTGSLTNSVSMSSNLGLQVGQMQLPPSGSTTGGGGMVGVNMGANLSSGVPPNQMPREVPNAALLCRLGQETVQEIVAKTCDLFGLLKMMQPPNGTQTSLNSQEEKKAKVQDALKIIGNLFKRLRKLYEKCNEACAGMEYIQIESLIPLREDSELPTNKPMQEDKKMSDALRCLTEEHRNYVEQLKLRNRHIKELIDNLRSIVWEINTMLAMRKP